MGSNDPNSTTWTELITGLDIDDGSDPSITQYISGETPYRYLAFVHNNLDSGLLTDRYGIEDNIFANNISVKVISTGYSDSNTMVVDGGTWSNAAINNSQVWSPNSSDNFSSQTPVTNMFDGDLTTAAGIKSSTTGVLC